MTGAISSTHALATEAGAAILAAGGTAFDAAVAAGFVLQVVEPHLNGPGGDLPAILWKDGQAMVLCAQGPAPAGATIERYRSEGLSLIPGDGLLATVIPGAFDGWMLMLRDHGTMELAEVLAPAIRLAEEGHPILEQAVSTIAGLADRFRDHWPGSAALWLPDGRPPEPGSLVKNPDLAATWRKLLDLARGDTREARIDAARDVFYRGFIAREIAAFCSGFAAMDASGTAHHGLLTAADLAGYSARYEAPQTFDYAGWTVAKTAAWGQGPVLLQSLSLLAGYDLAALDPLGAEFVHLSLEAQKLAFADREAYYGDPEVIPVPMDGLLSADYAAARAALIGGTASGDLRPGVLPGYEAQVARMTALLDRVSRPDGAVYEPTMAHLIQDKPGQAEDRSAGPSAGQASGQTHGQTAGTGGPATGRAGDSRADRVAAETDPMSDPARPGVARGDTVHLDVIDRWGNMVSATPSGGWLQSSPVIPGLGFCLNSRAQMFWLDADVPGSLAPGKRPRTTLSPSLAWHRDGRRLSFGTPGGDQQDQWQLVFLLRLIHHCYGLQAALDAPSFHSVHMPASFYPRTREPGGAVIESDFPQTTLRDLEARGHRLRIVEPHSLGRVTAALREADGTLEAGVTCRATYGSARVLEDAPASREGQPAGG